MSESQAYADDAKAASERIGREVLARLRCADVLDEENAALRAEVERLGAEVERLEETCCDCHGGG